MVGRRLVQLARNLIPYLLLSQRCVQIVEGPLGIREHLPHGNRLLVQFRHMSARGLAVVHLALYLAETLLRQLDPIAQMHPRRVLPALFAPGAGKRLVHFCLHEPDDSTENRVLRHRLQRLGQAQLAGIARILLKAPIQNRRDLILIAEQSRADERFWNAAPTALSARRVDTPLQQVLQPALDLPTTRILHKLGTIAGEIQVARAATAPVKPLADAPNALGFGFKCQCNLWLRVCLPVDEIRGGRRRILQQEGCSNGFYQRRLAEFVGAVTDIEAGTEFKLGGFNTREIRDA